MMSKQKILALLGAVSIGLAGCSDSGGGGGGGGVAANGCSGALAGKAWVICDGTNAILSGTVDEDLTLSGSFDWFLDGFVFIGGGAAEIASEAQADAIRAAGVTLTIPAGTHVQGLDDGALVVSRGSTIIADGTETSPITFSSASDADFNGAGEWGGVVIQGWGEQYGLGGTGVCHGGTQSYCNIVGEGGAGFFGGDDNADNSGVFRYVRIAEGGLVAGPNDEVNGLTLQGVGHGTVVDFVQVHHNLDDAVEWFGGAVNATHLVLTGNDDDDIDFDQGWQGNVQYALAIKADARVNAGNDPRGIEANSSDEEFVPETHGALANVSLIGRDASNTPTLEPGMRLRGALTVELYNTAVSGYDDECVRIDNADTDGLGTIEESTVALTNVIGTGCAAFYDHEDPTSSPGFVTETGTVGDNAFTYDAAFAIVEAVADVGATTITAVNNGSAFVFDQTDYIGAVEPGTAAADAWWADWTLPGTVQ